MSLPQANRRVQRVFEHCDEAASVGRRERPCFRGSTGPVWDSQVMIGRPDPNRRFDSALTGVLGALGVAMLGFGSAVTIWLCAAAIDGVSADEYDAGNRAAAYGLLLLSVVALPLAAVAQYSACWLSDRGLMRSVIVAQLPTVLALLLLPAVW
jgi:hypothetical protein